MTEALYATTKEYSEAANKENPKRHVSVSRVLHYLGVSKSGYYAWRKHTPSRTEKHRNLIKKKIQDIYDQSYQNYGAPKITVILNRAGNGISQRTTGKYMRQMGIHAQWVKHHTRTTIHSDFDQRLKNILNEQFNPDHPNAVWVSDITYIWTDEGFVYLTSIMDLYARRIISWTLSDTLEAKNVVATVNKAKSIRTADKPIIFHNDRGCQYVSEEFIKATEDMINSYSKKGYPWDNACIESFHSLIKREWLNRFKIKNQEQAYRLVFEYINAFYNTVRIHSHCNYQSPVEYENAYLDNLEKRDSKLVG